MRAGPFNTGFFIPLILATQPSEAKLPLESLSDLFYKADYQYLE